MFFDYLTGGQVVAGSNPAVPTNFLNIELFPAKWLVLNYEKVK